MQDISQVALAVFIGPCRRLHDDGAGQHMVMKAKNPGLGDFVNPTPRVALPGYIGLRLEDDARWQKNSSTGWAEWNVMLGYNEGPHEGFA